MANPTPKYRVKYDGQYLPGYVQSEDIPLTMRNAMVDILNRDGGTMYQNGANFRQLSLGFRILSRLDHVDSLLHLGDCLEQYRDALRISSRVESSSTLYLGDTSHYLLGRFTGASNPLVAPDHRAINYSMDFDVTPYFKGEEIQVSDSISGDDTLVIAISDTRKTYPRFSIPVGITGITVSHVASGKSFTMSGSHGTNWWVDCANLTVKRTNGDNSIHQLASGPDFGMWHTGSGSFTVDITNVTGSGTMFMWLTPRLER